MNGYQRRRVMNDYQITPEQDFIIGLVFEKRLIAAGDILRECIAMKVASHATAHKYFKDLVDRQFLSFEKRRDLRHKDIFLSPKSITYLQETK